jgi:hypothetical protein
LVDDLSREVDYLGLNGVRCKGYSKIVSLLFGFIVGIIRKANNMMICQNSPITGIVLAEKKIPLHLVHPLDRSKNPSKVCHRHPYWPKEIRRPFRPLASQYRLAKSQQIKILRVESK